MTNEEAIKILKPLFEHCKGKNECLGYIEHFFTEDEEEALDMAIKALEQQPCEDYVSRAKAIEICKSRGYDNSAHYISELPSVTPQRPKGKWIDNNCSICGYGVNPWNKTPYCPNCGSDMRESEEEK